ncbi:protein RALF-like 19 [Senna tora]|uniref:Protein RALF-like 19 n=1 Tax=Senna tora TaxID=362788 RepID=A0A834TQ48_9FABA|nr:protein RALF-like 19 [Senna tora]
MEFKPWLVLLVLALAVMVMAEASSSVHDMGLHRTVEESIGEDGEMLSESTRRTLRVARYLSYNALKANKIPCGQRGRSYYNCNARQRANPYNRGCSVITNCYRWTD